MDDETCKDFLNFNPLLQVELAEKFPELKPLLNERHAHKDWQKTYPPGSAINFKNINDSLSIEDVAKYLNLEVKNHFCNCPFHNDKTPSMRIYEKNYHCFGCGASGDSIDLTSKLLDIRPTEAVAILNRAFHMGYDLNKKASHKQMRIRKIEALKKKIYQEWHNMATLLMSNYIHVCYDVANALSTDICMKERSIAEAERVEALQDSMFETIPYNAWLVYRKEVAEIDERMQRRKKRASEDRI